MGQSVPFSEDDLRRAAGPLSYARGAGYLDQVEHLQIAGTWVTATVYGNSAYRVRLTFDAKPGTQGVRGDCSCPFGAEGNFCKHCVAAGLAALESGGLPAVHAQAASARGPGAVIAWLNSLSKDELIFELVDLLAEEPELYDRFELRAAARQVDVEGVRNVVSRLVRVTDYVDYDRAGEYAGDVTRAAEAIEELVEAGAAAAAIDVARDAIEWLRQSFGVVDDSDGDVGNAGYELLDVHLIACRAAPPDPASLAWYLADLCLTDQWGLRPAFTDYVSLLGEVGGTVLHERIAAAYEASPGDYRARQLMESVLETEGDVDALIAFCAAHLDERGWQHLRIAKRLDEAGRGDEALDWAERGVLSGPQPDSRLVDYLVDRYKSAGHAGDVVRVRRLVFEADRTLANCRALREAAVECGVWEAERVTALRLLRQDAAAVKGKTLWFPWEGPVLVDALIDDGDLAAAWTAAEGIASEPQWVRLANESVSTRPADALAVYVRVIERLTQSTGNATYRQIATHLLAARECHEALGTNDKFRQYMVLLRMSQKRKRNLMKILHESGL